MTSILDKARNSGIDCLKVLMCYIVVLCHCWDPEQSFNLSVKVIHPVLNLAVPTFFLMSFYLCGNLFTSQNQEKRISDRLKRLVLPHIFWAVTGFVVLMLVSAIIGSQKLSISDFGWQLLGGHSYDRAMWFQIDLIILTIAFYLAIKFFNNDAILYFLIAIAFILEYTGANHAMFGDLRKELRYTLGRIIEMIPYCATGIILARKHILYSLGKHWIPYSLICTAIIACHYLSILKFNGESFQYAGFDLYLTSLSIVIMFWIVPFNKLPYLVRNILKWLSGYTLGIYCMHSLIPEIGVAKGSLLKCTLIYMICMAISYLISLIPCKKIQMAVK